MWHHLICLCISAREDILNPGSSFLGPQPAVDIPEAQELFQNLLDLQTAVEKQTVDQEIKKVGDILHAASGLIDAIVSRLLSTTVR